MRGARRLGLDTFEDLGRLEAMIFGDLLERMKPEPDDPVRVGKVDPQKRR